MKRVLWLIFLAGIISFSLQPAQAVDNELNIAYPFVKETEEILVLKPYFHQSFLDFLEKNSVHAVIDRDGLPLTYFSEEPRFGCSGFCSNITVNNYTFGSKSLDYSGLPYEMITEDTVVAGNSGIEQSIDTMNAIRESLKNDPEALASFERYLLEEQEGFLRGTYYDELHDDVWDYAVSKIQEDPNLYGSLTKELGMGNMEEAIGRLEEYMKGEFDINGAFDLSNMYSAIENGQLGNMQVEEFMRNVLNRIAENENMDINLDDMNLEEFSELLNTEEFREMMERVSEMMENNPEMFDRLADLAKEMMESPETREVFKEALKEMMKNADWDTIKNLMDAFSKMENKQELMETLMESMGEYMREMVESGQMDEMLDMMNDPAMREMMAEAFQSFSQEMFESMGEWIKEIPIEFSYVVALIAIIATLLILMKLRM
jgi:tetratricopeptide (TPR) repeat protein